MESSLDEDVQKRVHRSMCLTRPGYSFIDNYFYRHNEKLPENFYQRIIELENEVERRKQSSVDNFIIEELSNLYKTAVEHFSGTNPNKVQFYYNKLQHLLTDKKFLRISFHSFAPSKQDTNDHTDNAIQNTNCSHYDKSKSKSFLISHTSSLAQGYLDQRRKMGNQIMLFLSNEKFKSEVSGLVQNFYMKIKNATEKIEEELADQKQCFLTKKKNRKLSFKKKMASVSEELKLKRRKSRTDELFENQISDFFRKFRFIFYSNIFEKPMEVLKEILQDGYLEKIRRYFYYQDQIKQFELLILDDDSEQHKESIKLILSSLHVERESNLYELNKFIGSVISEIKNLGEEVNISRDENVMKYTKELMLHITEFFK